MMSKRILDTLIRRYPDLGKINQCEECDENAEFVFRSEMGMVACTHWLCEKHFAEEVIDSIRDRRLSE